MRVALVTLAAPWPEGATGLMWNRHQPDGINQIGHHCEVFVISPTFPRFLERIRPSLKRFNDRPRQYTFMDVVFHVIKGWVMHPVFVRWKISPRSPGIGGRLVSWSVERKLLKELRKFKPDALLVHDTVINGALGIRLSKKLGVPFGTIDHDPIDADPQSPIGKHFQRIGKAAQVIFNVGVIGYLHHRDVLKISNARLLPNGTAQPTEAQRQTPRPSKWQGKKVVLCVGAYIERKGHKELLKAFADANVPDAILVNIGEPPEQLKQLVKELKIEDRVEFTPGMSQQEVQQYMVWADLFALPSWWECAALVYIEAMSAQTPPIMTEDCGLTYVVEQGVNGWVIPPKDHAALVNVLREALARPDLKEMGKRGRIMAETRFRWTKNAEMVIAGLRNAPDPMPALPANIKLPSMRPEFSGANQTIKV